MAEGGMAQVVGQRDGLGQVLIQRERSGYRARNLGDLNGMGQTGSKQVTLVIDEYLGLVLETAKGRGMDDAIPVSLEFTAVGRAFLVLLSAQGVLVFYGIWGQGRQDYSRV